jgi:hypothetical protein
MATPVQSPIYQQELPQTTASEPSRVPTETGGPIFKSYGDYLVATKTQTRPSSSYNATVTTPTGFLEFKPRDMEIQRKYDAMSPTWEGVDSSMRAVEQGIYSLDAAEATRQELRESTRIVAKQGPTTLYLNQTPKEILARMRPSVDSGIPAKKPNEEQFAPPGICTIQ